MRIPHTVPQQTLRAYDCSNETRQLIGERRRIVNSERRDWDATIVSPLRHLSVKALVDNFRGYNILEILPPEDLLNLLECLPVSLPFEITIPLVPDGEFWKRCAQHTWSSMNVVQDYGGSWRRLMLERTLEHELEEALPAMLEEALRVSRLAGHLVRRLRLRRLLQTAPLPSGWTSDRTFECRELTMLDSELEALREDLQTVMEYLVNLSELDIMFGMNDFEKNLSEPPSVVKVHCCQALGKALSYLPNFRHLRVHRSQMHIEALTALLEPLQASATLSVLDVRNCYLGDKGVQIVAAFISEHPTLTILRISNNKFGARGATYVAKALLQKTCAPLTELDISLNAIGDVGGHNVLMALVPKDDRQPLRDPAEDEDVRALILAEERAAAEQQARQQSGEQESTHEGVAFFRGLVARALASEVKSEDAANGNKPGPPAEDEYISEWEVDVEQAPRQTAFLAEVVAEARQVQQLAAEEEALRLEEEQRALDAAAAAAERWPGAPERLLAVHLAGCKMSAAVREALLLLLRSNKTLTTLTVANNHLGEDACSAMTTALQSNTRMQLLDLRMCGAAWQDEAAGERALRRNLAALRQPLRLQDRLKEREEELRAQMATTTEVLGRQWERGAPRAPLQAARTPSVVSGLSGSLLLGGSGSGSAPSGSAPTRSAANTGSGTLAEVPLLPETGFVAQRSGTGSGTTTSNNKYEASSISSRVSHPQSFLSLGSDSRSRRQSNISHASKSSHAG